jgi:hypothetical protein
MQQQLLESTTATSDQQGPVDASPDHEHPLADAHEDWEQELQKELGM